MIDLEMKVGRIVVRKSDTVGMYVEPLCIGKITEVSGKRLQYDRRIPGGTESRFLLERTVAAVCDTEEEVQMLLGFSFKAHRLFTNLQEDLDREWSQITGVA